MISSFLLVTFEKKNNSLQRNFIAGTFYCYGSETFHCPSDERIFADIGGRGRTVSKCTEHREKRRT